MFALVLEAMAAEKLPMLSSLLADVAMLDSTPDIRFSAALQAKVVTWGCEEHVRLGQWGLLVEALSPAALAPRIKDSTKVSGASVSCLTIESILSRLILAVSPSDAKKEEGTLLALQSCVTTLVERGKEILGWEDVSAQVLTLHRIISSAVVPIGEVEVALTELREAAASVMGATPLLIALKRTGAGNILIDRASAVFASRHKEKAAADRVAIVRTAFHAAEAKVKEGKGLLGAEPELRAAKKHLDDIAAVVEKHIHMEEIAKEVSEIRGAYNGLVDGLAKDAVRGTFVDLLHAATSNPQVDAAVVLVENACTAVRAALPQTIESLFVSSVYSDIFLGMEKLKDLIRTAASLRSDDADAAHAWDVSALVATLSWEEQPLLQELIAEDAAADTVMVAMQQEVVASATEAEDEVCAKLEAMFLQLITTDAPHGSSAATAAPSQASASGEHEIITEELVKVGRLQLQSARKPGPRMFSTEFKLFK